MEELRRAALAYYNKSSPEFQAMAYNYFKAMDTNGDERVSFPEFVDFHRCNGYAMVDTHRWFPRLDSNHDGSLDFWEILTFYYVLKTRGVWCANCAKQLHALYFTCVECFDARCPFDLCSTCYGERPFWHHHSLFLDSYVLLRSKLGCPGEDLNNAITQPENSPNYNTNHWLTALDVALAAANITATLSGCTIM